MPRKSKKAAAREAQARYLERDAFSRFVRDVGAAKQELNDAGTAHASAWKKADPLGIHPEAAKLYCRLDRMEDTKRTDFLRSFDRYRGWAEHWAVQADLLEQEPAGTAEHDEHEQGEERDQQEDDAHDLTERESVEAEMAPVAEAAPEVEADVGEDGAAEATEELANAGYTFAAGKEAALEGQPAEANPHPETSPSHPIWARGHAQGLREKEEGTETEAETAVVPLNGRRSRGAAHEAAVH